MSGDSEDWAAARAARLRESGEDPHATIGFLRTTLGFHRLGPFTATIGSMPLEAIVVRSNGTIERRPFDSDTIIAIPQ